MTQPRRGMLRPESTRQNGSPSTASIAVDGVPRRDLGEAFELQQLLLRQPVEVGHRGDEPSLQSRRIVCSPTPSMSAAMTQLMSVSSPRDGHARFGQRCIASPSGLTTLPRRAGTFRASGTASSRAVCGSDRADHLRDHVAGALDDHVVALADVLAVDVLLVVERRAARR